MKITEQEFKENSIVLSMVGGSRVSDFRAHFGYNPTVLYGLNTADKFERLQYKYDGNKITPEIYHYINNLTGTLGCHMQHYYAIHMAFALGKEFIVIMEDDVFPIEKFETLSKAVEELPEDFDCFNFGWIPSIVLKERCRTPKDFSTRLYVGDGMECSGAFGYMLSRSGIQKALSILSDVRVPTDFQFKFMKSYYMKTPYLGHPPANGFSRIRNPK